MMRTRWLAAALLTAVCAAACATGALAGNDERTGTNGGGELQLPVGARSIALAGADLGTVDGVEALYYNPAGMAATDAKTDLQFSYTSYIADIKLNYFAVAQSLGKLGYLGASVKVLSIGDIPLTTETAPEGTGEMFSPTFSVIGVSYARQMTDRVNFGGTVSYVAERILQETAAGVAFDFGFQYDTGLNGTRLGVAMKNFGRQMNYSGADLERDVLLSEDDPQAKDRTLSLTTADFELPSSFQMGASMPIIRGDLNQLTAHALYQNNAFGLDHGRVGVEYGYRNLAALRAGYLYSSDSERLFSFSYGAGFRVPVGTGRLSVDYAGQAVRDFFDNVQHLTLSLRF